MGILVLLVLKPLEIDDKVLILFSPPVRLRIRSLDFNADYVEILFTNMQLFFYNKHFVLVMVMFSRHVMVFSFPFMASFLPFVDLSFVVVLVEVLLLFKLGLFSE
jgi:hypothetical protein